MCVCCLLKALCIIYSLHHQYTIIHKGNIQSSVLYNKLERSPKLDLLYIT